MDKGDAELLLHAPQLAAHAQAKIFVERRERLVSSSTRGLVISARASATRCCWPPESWAGSRSAKFSSWTLVDQLARLGWRSAPPAPRIFSAKATLSSTLRCGNRA